MTQFLCIKLGKNVSDTHTLQGLWNILEQSQTHRGGGVRWTFWAFSSRDITNRNTRLSLTVPLCILDCSDTGLWRHHTTLHYGTDILVNSSFQSDPQGKADHTPCPAFKETWQIRQASSQGRATGGGGNRGNKGKEESGNGVARK